MLLSMMFKKWIPLATAATVGFVLSLGLQPHAQTAPQKVGFVDTLKVLQAHPMNSIIQDLNAKANKDLQPLQEQIKALQAKGSNLSAKEKQDLDTAIKTYQASSEKWQKQINANLAPLTEEVNKAVAVTAKKDGFSIVMDRSTAASSGLVIYADEASTDFTDDVIKAVKK